MGQERLIPLLDERGDLLTSDDGYVIFWPTENHGAFTASDLRLIADEIDKRNKDWDETVCEISP